MQKEVNFAAAAVRIVRPNAVNFQRKNKDSPVDHVSAGDFYIDNEYDI